MCEITGLHVSEGKLAADILLQKKKAEKAKNIIV